MEKNSRRLRRYSSHHIWRLWLTSVLIPGGRPLACPSSARGRTSQRRLSRAFPKHQHLHLQRHNNAWLCRWFKELVGRTLAIRTNSELHHGARRLSWAAPNLKHSSKHLKFQLRDFNRVRELDQAREKPCRWKLCSGLSVRHPHVQKSFPVKWFTGIMGIICMIK